MARKQSRIPGMAAAKSHHVPICSSCKRRTQKDLDGNWICIHCMNDFAAEFLKSQTRGRSLGGVDLPSGVSDERIEIPDVRPMIPNRRQRRAAGVR